MSDAPAGTPPPEDDTRPWDVPASVAADFRVPARPRRPVLTGPQAGLVIGSVVLVLSTMIGVTIWRATRGDVDRDWRRLSMTLPERLDGSPGRPDAESADEVGEVRGMFSDPPQVVRYETPTGTVVVAAGRAREPLEDGDVTDAVRGFSAGIAREGGAVTRHRPPPGARALVCGSYSAQTLCLVLSRTAVELVATWEGRDAARTAHGVWRGTTFTASGS